MIRIKPIARGAFNGVFLIRGPIVTSLAWGCGALFISCHDSRESPALGTQSTAAAAESTVLAVPSFRREILPVFDHHCSSAKGCHGAEPTESVDLDLRAAAAYGELVDQPAEARPGALRVKPEEASASFLIDKLTGRLSAQEGKQMPIDVDSGAPIEPSPLPPKFIANVLRPWIQAGAPNN